VTAAPPYNRPLHWLAVACAVTTFPLIFLGGLVTSHQAGLSVPDWPNSYGYNMFLFPIHEWKGGILFEHTHRLMGTLVGFCSVLFCFAAWGVARNPVTRRILWIGTAAALALTALFTTLAIVQDHPDRPGLKSWQAQWAVGFAALGLFTATALPFRRPEPRAWVRMLSLIMLAGVIFQGALGGLRVVGLKLNLAIVHACFAQAFFCLAVLAVIVTSKWWLRADAARTEIATPPGRRLVRLAVCAWLLIYAQLIVGATMRHYGAGLAIPDLPLALGKVIPPTAQSEVTAAWMTVVGDHWNDWNPLHDQEFLGPTTAQVWLAFGHRIGAVLVSIGVIALCIAAFRRRKSGLAAPAGVLLSLLVLQVTLGVLTVLLKKPADVASYHVAVGALVLATTFVLAVRSMRLYSPAFRLAIAKSDPRGFEVNRRTAIA